MVHMWCHNTLVIVRHYINNVYVSINVIINIIATGWSPGGPQVVPRWCPGGAQGGAQMVPICGNCHHYHTLIVIRHSINIMCCIPTTLLI